MNQLNEIRKVDIQRNKAFETVKVWLPTSFKHALDRKRLKSLRLDFWFLQENWNYDFLSDNGYEEIGNEIRNDIAEYGNNRIENETEMKEN